MSISKRLRAVGYKGPHPLADLLPPTRICNRCDRVRSCSIGLCDCGCPEFRTGDPGLEISPSFSAVEDRSRRDAGQPDDGSPGPVRLAVSVDVTGRATAAAGPRRASRSSHEN